VGDSAVVNRSAADFVQRDDSNSAAQLAVFQELLTCDLVVDDDIVSRRNRGPWGKGRKRRRRRREKEEEEDGVRLVVWSLGRVKWSYL